MLATMRRALGLTRATFAASAKGAPYPFHGGLVLEANKRALGNYSQQGLCSSVATVQAITEIALPEQLIIPLSNYQNQTLTPSVVVGQKLERGQPIAASLLAPAAGTVHAIEARDVLHPGGLQQLSVVIRCDKIDADADTLSMQAADPPDNAAVHVQENLVRFLADPDAVFDKSALSGLGGAGFPSADKIQAGAGKLQTLIINAAECEPEIACDEALMQIEPVSIARGVDALMRATHAQRCVVAIEDSKPLAFEQLSRAMQAHCPLAQILRIPTRYPTGAESLLIKTVTGRAIPHSEKPIHHGVLCINVATVHALWQAINGQPLDSRVVSLGGAAMPNPCNVRVRFGTPVSYVLEQTDNGITLNGAHRLRAGGPLSGYDLHSSKASVTAKTNCLLAEPLLQTIPAQACIRCGHCADVCPARLLPQQLHWYALAEEFGKCARLDLDACIECGCCDLVCPSSIKLTETFRYAKAQSRFIQQQQAMAAKAEARFAEREQRLVHRETARQASIAERKKNLQASRQPENARISDALARVRAKRHKDRDT